MRSTSEGKSSTTTLSWMPAAEILLYQSRHPLVQFVSSVGNHREFPLLPELSIRVLPERLKPARWGSAMAALSDPGMGLMEVSARSDWPLKPDGCRAWCRDKRCGRYRRALCPGKWHPGNRRIGTSAVCNRERHVRNLMNKTTPNRATDRHRPRYAASLKKDRSKISGSSIQDVEFAPAEPQQVEFAILLDLKPDGIEIGQRASLVSYFQ